MRTVVFFLVLALLSGLFVAGWKGRWGEPEGLRGVLDRAAVSGKNIEGILEAAVEVTPAEEEAWGEGVYREFLAHTPPVSETEIQAYVESVARTLLLESRVADFRSYRITVIESGEFLAFALPGRKVLVSRGLLRSLDSECALALVLGHEIAHQLHGHTTGIVRQAKLAEKLALPLEGLFGFLRRGYSEAEEYEADLRGLVLALEARYHPRGVTEVMDRLSELEAKRGRPRGTSLPVLEEVWERFLATHPRAEERRKKLELYLGRARVPERAYVGRENFQRLVSRSHREYPSEWVPVQGR